MKPIETMKPGEYKDVIFRRGPNANERSTNIPRVVHESDDIEWGYPGTGPLDFSLNIMLHFTNGDEAFSRFQSRIFCREIVAHLPKEGGTISAEKIQNWIEHQRKTTKLEDYLSGGYFGTCDRERLKEQMKWRFAYS